MRHYFPRLEARPVLAAIRRFKAAGPRVVEREERVEE